MGDDQECDRDVVAYERNMITLPTKYNDHPTNESHIEKLLKVTHKLQRDKINNSALPVGDIEKNIHF